jgi:hypothetical protein
MTDTEKSPTPFAIPDMEKGNLLHTTDVAKVITRPGDDRRDSTVRVRGFVNRGYLYPVGRDKNDARGALLFNAGSAVTSAVLLAATDAGLSGKDQFERLALCLQSAWEQPDGVSPMTRATFILDAHQRNPEPQGWGVELHTSRHPETGQISYQVAIKHGENGYLGTGVTTVPDGYMPVAALLLPLDPYLPGILANLATMQKKRGMN